MEYKMRQVNGRFHVVGITDRKGYYVSVPVTDKEGNPIEIDGIKQRKKLYVEGPKYLGVKGQVLCGVLRSGQTLENWIKRKFTKNKKEK